MHAVWLWLVHESERVDKRLWCAYRDEACRLVGIEREPEAPKIKFGRKILWLLPEVGVTVGFVVVFLLRVRV